MSENMPEKMMDKKGAFPIQWITELMKQGAVKNAVEKNLAECALAKNADRQKTL